MTNALVICGSPRDPSRTRALAERAAATLRDRNVDTAVLDLGTTQLDDFDGREHGAYDDTTTEAIERILAADLLFMASPVYFGGMPGALKTLIDHIPYERFTDRQRSAGLLMTGRDRRHQHVLESQLRSTLVYLGVDVATPSVFLTEEGFDGVDLLADVDPYLGNTIDATIALLDR
ncbi:MAG: NADPH-dependent FMN reductase [Salinirussus sp.]